MGSAFFFNENLEFPNILNGLPGDYLSNEILETVCTSQGESIFFTTNLMINQKMDLRKLLYLLKDHVDFFRWEPPEKQEVTPVNIILNLLKVSKSTGGVFKMFKVSKNLLLKSNWVGRLGGRGKIEASNGELVFLVATETGLEMEGDEGSEDGSEDEDDEDEEEEEEKF